MTYYEAELPTEVDGATNISGTARVFKCGSDIKINFNVTGIITKATTEIVLFTLPVGYRPYLGFVIVNYITQYGTQLLLTISGIDGNVVISRPQAGEWITGDWIIRQEVSFFAR